MSKLESDSRRVSIDKTTCASDSRVPTANKNVLDWNSVQCVRFEHVPTNVHAR